MLEKILQKIGDIIISQIKWCEEEKHLETIFKTGLYYDDWVVRNFNIYLK